jgi:hypothetical protein
MAQQCRIPNNMFTSQVGYLFERNVSFLRPKIHVYLNFFITLGNELIFIDAQQATNIFRYDFIVRKNGFLTIPCKSTHPNVTFSLTHKSHYIGEGLVPNLEDFPDLNEMWLADPRFKKRPTKVSSKMRTKLNFFLIIFLFLATDFVD